MIRLHGMKGSGNCWKPAALMRLLDIPFQWIDVDILAGQSRTPEFLALNPNGRVPLLELATGQYLAESNAMLWHLARGTAWIPAGDYAQSKVLEWMFFEQYSHEPYIATVRYWVHLQRRAQEMRERIAEAMPRGYAALGVMEARLQSSPYLVGDQASIADLALFAYTHVADEGGYDLAGYPAVHRWMERLRALPDFCAMRD